MSSMPDRTCGIHHPGLVIAESHAPVEAIGAQINVAPPRQCSPRSRPASTRNSIPGEYTDNALIRFQCSASLAVQIFIGQDIVIVFLIVEPGDDRQVSWQPQAMFILDVRYFGRMLQSDDDRSCNRRHCRPPTITSGKTKLFVLIQLDVDFGQDRRHPCDGLNY